MMPYYMMVLLFGSRLASHTMATTIKATLAPMYDGLTDLMSYETSISSYGCNSAAMAKSFFMVVKNVAQTWYSSLRPRSISSWQKLKDLILTNF
jgi:hypothetical protein